MGKQREGGLRLPYRRAVVCGLGAAVFFVILIFILALVSELAQTLFQYSGVSVRACLGVCAVLCAILSAGNAQQNRLLYALAGEAVLLAGIVLIGISHGFGRGWKPIAADVGIMLIGAFAGAISQGGIRRKRRGNR